MENVASIEIDQANYEAAADIYEKIAEVKFYKEKIKNLVGDFYKAVLYTMVFKGAGAREKMKKYGRINLVFKEYNYRGLQPIIESLEQQDKEAFNRLQQLNMKGDYVYKVLEIVKKKYLS